MSLILVIIIVVVLFGGGGYYGYRRYGGPGLSGVIALVSIMFLALWLAGGLHLSPRADLGSTKSPVFVILGAH